MERSYRIALVIKTDGLEYDDRVRKEILTIKKLYPNIYFKVFCMLPDNKEYEGVTGYGVPFKALYLPSRNKYPSAKKILRKTYDFYKVVKNDLKEFDAVWCGDYHSVAIALFCRNKPVLWDLHELPSMLLGNRIKEMVLRCVFKNCRVVVHANQERLDYLQELGLIKNRSKHFVLRNFPNFEDQDKSYDENYKKFICWKGDRACVYLQGLTNEYRAAFESIDAVLSHKQLLAVVVGSFEDYIMKELREKWGCVLDERVLFMGKIPQLKIPQYVKECLLSLVFYRNIDANHYYCEANRFYQSVILGVPVVVGNNPSMKSLVEKYNFGVSIDTDGSDIDKISKGIETVLNHLEEYKVSIQHNKNKLIWAEQEGVVKDIIVNLLSLN